MRKSVVLFAVIVLSSLHASAQTTKPQPRPHSPTSFLGIQFGKPISESVRECARYEASVDTCFESHSDYYTVRNVEMFTDVSVHEVDGKVENVDAYFNTDSATEIAHALREKYGAPVIDEVTHLQNSMGAQIRGRRTIWHWAHVNISFKSPDKEIDEGLVSAYTPAYIASIEQENKKEKDALKGIL